MAEGQIMEAQFPEVSPKNEGSPVNGTSPWAMLGVSPAIQNVGRIIGELANSSVPVLLIGETGCGKRAAAEHIHLLSARSLESFEIVESRDVTEATIAGLVKGTVFLDEIAQLTDEAQRVLLARLSAKNGNGHQAGVARIICGTACDLEAEVRGGRFREDLYYRISAVSLRIPPLRQRK